MAVTLRELADMCGLSVSTVSKALNGYSDIGEETRLKVRKMAASAGYRPNSTARGLKTGRSFNLGVLYSDDTDSGFTHCYFGPILQAFKQETEAQGYDLTFITRRLGRSPMTYLEHCQYRNVDGVCVVCVLVDDPGIPRLLTAPIPAVTVDFLFNNRTCIQSENRQGMEMLTQYVLSMGHRRVAMVRGSEGYNPIVDVRQSVFLHTMSEAGVQVPDHYIVSGAFHDPRATRKATEKLIGLPDRPTCILLPDDYAAQGGMEAIRNAGLRVPEDISVAGYDGVPWIQQIRPRLTTVRQDTDTIGREAARRLISQIESPRTSFPEIVPVPCALLPGETVRPVSPNM